jgi:H+/Cl- antiporter ClcA
LRIDHAEQARSAWHLVRFMALGSIVGVLAGLSSAAFLESLRWATDLRENHPWLLWLLPVAGLAVGLVYHHGAGRAADGNNLIIDEIHEPRAWIPRRMAPLIYVATVVSHIFGASVGREGTAIQMSGSLTDGLFGRMARITGTDRRLLLIAAIAGGFGAVFGVPFAGCVFALEVQAAGRIRHDAIVPALTASIVGARVVRGLGVHHDALPIISGLDLTVPLVLKILVAGFAFGATALVFSELTHGIKHAFQSGVRWAPLRPFIGGVLIVGLTYAVGTRDYLGLSTPLITESLAGGAGIVAAAFALKLLFTSITLGSGFQGGEVTPLFVMGATLGATMGNALGVPVPLFAAMGFVAVFAGATNTPIACTIMGVELFGAGALVPMAMACVVSYVISGNRGIYGAQRIELPEGDGITVESMAKRRRMWLPARHSADSRR